MTDLLIPVKKARPGDGAFTWPSRIALATTEPADLVPLERVRRAISRELGGHARIVPGAEGPSAVRVRRGRVGAHPEGYRLSVRPEGILATAATDVGAYHALMTLRELVALHGRTIPALEISDRPDLDRRGVSLDCSRGKVPTLDALKRLVELLAAFKLNELQLYVENVFTFHRHPAIGCGFSPFTPGDILALRAHAATHHVRLVPSLASFGHMERILTLPQYAALGEKAGHMGFPGGTTLCPGDARSIRLVRDLHDEYLPLFDAVDFNACADETIELGEGRSRRRAARDGVGAVYLGFLHELRRSCARHGKRMNIWADIVLAHPETIGELPEDVVLLNWEYDRDGPRIARTRELAEAGRRFLVCPGTGGWQSHGTRLENAMANTARFARVGRRYHADGLLQTDWGDHGHRNTLGVSVHGFAHAAAHAWRGAGVDDARFTDLFAERVLGAPDLADALRTLGAADATAGAPLYHAFAEGLDARRDAFRGIPRISPVRVPPPLRRRPVEQASEEGCRRVVEQLADAGAWPAAARRERWIAQDLTLGAEMARLSARWLLAARAHRAGRAVPPDDARQLARAIRRAAGHFERNWTAGNRRARLRDNLTLLAGAAAECDALAGRP